MPKPNYLAAFKKNSVMADPDAAPVYKPYSSLDQTMLDFLAGQGDLGALEALAEKAYGADKGPESDAAAAAMFRKGAEGGNQEAMFMLSGCYYQGTGVDQDYDQYFYWTKQAADAGSWKAARNLATAYFRGPERYHGHGPAQNDEKALEWSIRTAELQEEYWRYYTQPGFSAFKDETDNLVDEYSKTVELIAKHYQAGKGTQQSYTQAVAWLKRGNALIEAASGKTYAYFDSGIAALSALLEEQ